MQGLKHLSADLLIPHEGAAVVDSAGAGVVDVVVVVVDDGCVAPDVAADAKACIALVISVAPSLRIDLPKKNHKTNTITAIVINMLTFFLQNNLEEGLNFLKAIIYIYHILFFPGVAL